MKKFENVENSVLLRDTSNQVLINISDSDFEKRKIAKNKSKSIEQRFQLMQHKIDQLELLTTQLLEKLNALSNDNII